MKIRKMTRLFIYPVFVEHYASQDPGLLLCAVTRNTKNSGVCEGSNLVERDTSKWVNTKCEML